MFQESKLNLEQIQKDYPPERYSVAQALAAYLEDNNRLIGSEGVIDAVALQGVFKSLYGEDIDILEYVPIIKDVLQNEMANRRDLAWKVIEDVVEEREQTEDDEPAKGTLGF